MADVEDLCRYIQREYDCDHASAGRIAGMFVSRLPEDLAALRQAAAAGDWDMVFMLGHRLKGGAGNVGSKEFSEGGVALELAAKDGDAAAAAEIIDGLEQILTDYHTSGGADV